MSIDIINIVVYSSASLILTMGTFIIRNVLLRIDSLEERMREAVTEQQVRQVLQDRYEPVLEDIKEIKEKLNKLFDLYVDAQRNGTNRST